MAAITSRLQDNRNALGLLFFDFIEKGNQSSVEFARERSDRLKIMIDGKSVSTGRAWGILAGYTVRRGLRRLGWGR